MIYTTGHNFYQFGTTTPFCTPWKGSLAKRKHLRLVWFAKKGGGLDFSPRIYGFWAPKFYDDLKPILDFLVHLLLYVFRKNGFQLVTNICVMLLCENLTLSLLDMTFMNQNFSNLIEIREFIWISFVPI